MQTSLNIAVFEINIKLNCTCAYSNSAFCVALKNSKDDESKQMIGA